MEATGVSIGKSVLDVALGCAKSAVAEEISLQLGVHRDKAFVTGELEMMRSFLVVAHDEQDDHRKVVMTWVKQVHDVAYDVEDCLQDFVVRLQKKKQSWWRIPRTPIDRRNVAKQMMDLRAARQAAKQHQSRRDLAQLINREGNDLQVIGVWGTCGSVGHTSIIWEAYENPVVKLNFPYRAWVRVTPPSRPKDFIQSIVKQFQAVVGVTDIMLELEEEKKGHELALAYNGYVNNNRYLIVLTDLSTIEEWHQIKACLPENKLGSRIVVSTEQVEVASLSTGQGSMVSELKELSADQTIYAFYNQVLIQFQTHFTVD
ncbi:hypothetical protein ACQ4PT_049890 [Festuca glaucescens]